jgi:sugar-specific transcriptional regulator TrmB
MDRRPIDIWEDERRDPALRAIDAELAASRARAEDLDDPEERLAREESRRNNPQLWAQIDREQAAARIKRGAA